MKAKLLLLLILSFPFCMTFGEELEGTGLDVASETENAEQASTKQESKESKTPASTESATKKSAKKDQGDNKEEENEETLDKLVDLAPDRIFFDKPGDGEDKSVGGVDVEKQAPEVEKVTAQPTFDPIGRPPSSPSESVVEGLPPLHGGPAENAPLLESEASVQSEIKEPEVEPEVEDEPIAGLGKPISPPDDSNEFSELTERAPVPVPPPAPSSVPEPKTQPVVKTPSSPVASDTQIQARPAQRNTEPIRIMGGVPKKDLFRPRSISSTAPTVTRQPIAALPHVAEVAIVLVQGRFHPDRLRLKEGLETKLIFATTNRKPAALVIEQLRIQQWIAKHKLVQEGGLDDQKALELMREINENHITEVVLYPKRGSYVFHDALSGARGEIVVE